MDLGKTKIPKEQVDAICNAGVNAVLDKIEELGIPKVDKEGSLAVATGIFCLGMMFLAGCEAAGVNPRLALVLTEKAFEERKS